MLVGVFHLLCIITSDLGVYKVMLFNTLVNSFLLLLCISLYWLVIPK
jgi:hypothetical protein